VTGRSDLGRSDRPVRLLKTVGTVGGEREAAAGRISTHERLSRGRRLRLRWEVRRRPRGVSGSVRRRRRRALPVGALVRPRRSNASCFHRDGRYGPERGRSDEDGGCDASRDTACHFVLLMCDRGPRVGSLVISNSRDHTGGFVITGKPDSTFKTGGFPIRQVSTANSVEAWQMPGRRCRRILHLALEVVRRGRTTARPLSCGLLSSGRSRSGLTNSTTG
jgi:hypothetical protein